MGSYVTETNICFRHKTNNGQLDRYSFVSISVLFCVYQLGGCVCGCRDAGNPRINELTYVTDWPVKQLFEEVIKLTIDNFNYSN